MAERSFVLFEDWVSYCPTNYRSGQEGAYDTAFFGVQVGGKGFAAEDQADFVDQIFGFTCVCC